jgi:hypothetical protein
MATAQVNGSASTGTYNGGTTKNNGGAAKKAGSSTKLTNRSVKGVDVGFVGSKVINSTDVGNVKALSSGTFAFNNVRPIAERLTTSLATVANNALLRGATVPSQIRGIHKIESVATNLTATAFRAGFNLYTGRYVNSVSSQTDNLGNDVAANPTRSVPGRLVYKNGKDQSAVNYKAKTA